MLQIIIPQTELFDEARQEFIYVDKPTTLSLEHSLVSISKWESKWKKPYISDEEKTTEEVLDYIRCMTITQNVDPQVYYAISDDEIRRIIEYIEDGHTATTFTEIGTPRKKSSEGITSELVYYWMSAYQIPWEAQKWHFNRLMTLIKIASIKNSPEKKMSKSEAFRSQRELNALRRARNRSKG